VRFPDGIDRALRVLTEVKNVESLDLTPQLRDFLQYCEDNDYRLELWIRRSTKLTPRLKAALDEAGFETKEIIGSH
jgi:hypothetical protein